MSPFSKINKSSHKKLTETFPDLENLMRCDNSTNYQSIGLSVFDHWLSREEADNLLCDVSATEQMRRNSLFDKFNNLLISNTEVINFTHKGRCNRSYIKFRAFSSVVSQRSYLKHESIQRYQVVLPELEIIYLESYDDTNIIYYRNPDSLNKIKEWASLSGLNLLALQNG